jgi:molybdate transport system substrate-binding protein
MRGLCLGVRLLALPSLMLAVQGAAAAEIRILSAVLMKPALEDLSATFERATGDKLVMSFGTASVIKERIQKGEAADLTILPVPAMEELQKEGKAQADSVTVGRSLVAVSVRAGAPKPDITTPASLKQVLLAADSIVYSDPAGGAISGVHFAAVLARLGLTEEMRRKTKLTRVPGPGPAELVANGDAQLGISQPADILSVPGAELLGPLPAELQNTRDFVYLAALLDNTKQPAVAKAFIQFLRGSDAAAAMKKKGLEPG